jgi:5-methylcytosine-specific restriction protein A
MTIRHAPLPEAPKGKCRFCGGDIPPKSRRRAWCSEACHDEGWVRASGSFARMKVAKRDAGKCEECRTDTRLIMRAYREAAQIDHDGGTYRCRTCETELTTAGVCCGFWPEFVEARAARAAVIAEAEKLGFTAFDFYMARWRDEDALWQMDHRIPVVEGGGTCGLDNLRTLCLPCHRKATAMLAARRVHARRAEKKREARRA